MRSVREARAAVTLRGVSKWFIGRNDQTHALSSIDLDVATGEFVSVIGPSGCGKSTLLRVVDLGADGLIRSGLVALLARGARKSRVLAD